MCPDLLQKWLNIIQRENKVQTKHSSVSLGQGESKLVVSSTMKSFKNLNVYLK